MATVLISLGLIAVVALIVRSMYNDKKNGKPCHCGANCGACTTGCHSQK